MAGRQYYPAYDYWEQDLQDRFEFLINPFLDNLDRKITIGKLKEYFQKDFETNVYTDGITITGTGSQSDPLVSSAGTNIYLSDGTLTNNRIVSGDSFELTFDDLFFIINNNSKLQFKATDGFSTIFQAPNTYSGSDITYVLPTAQATGSMILQNDGAGNLSWVTLTPLTFIESITGDSVDNTDLNNPVVNAIPLAGTTVGNPVTGDIEVSSTGSGRKIHMSSLGFNSELFIDTNGISISVSTPTGTGGWSADPGVLNGTLSDNVHSTVLSALIDGWKLFGDDPTFKGMEYDGDYSANFQPFSLIDLQTLKKRFWTKAGAPTTTDDDTEGFIVGSLIWDTTNSILYRATSVTTGAAAWTVAIVAGSGTVMSVTDLSPSAIDNTDPDNPVTNIIPRSGTDVGFPVTGPIQGSNLTLIDDITDPTSFTSELQVGADVIIKVSDIVNAYNTRLFIGNGFVEIRSGDPVFEGITYGDDYSANFVDRSLVDKAYVDSVTPNITSGTAPPSGGNDGDIYLQYI